MKPTKINPIVDKTINITKNICKKSAETNVSSPLDCTLNQEKEIAAKVQTSCKKLSAEVLSIISPFENLNITEALNPENFYRIKYLKALNQEEKEIFRKTLSKGGDAGAFFATITGDKPACLLGSTKENLSFLEKLSKDKVFNENFEIKNLTYKVNDTNLNLTYILNKNEILKTIAYNKSLFTSRIEVNNNATANEIFDAIIMNKNDVLNSTLSGQYQDIIGLILGYPKFSSMMFQLEKTSGLNMVRIRRDTKYYKETLLEILNSEKSPYKKLDKDNLDGLKNAINSYKNSTLKSNYCYHYTSLAEEPEELKRIDNAINSFNRNFSVNNTEIFL